MHDHGRPAGSGADVRLDADADQAVSVKDVEDVVGVRKETEFYSTRELYRLPEYKTLHEEEKRRKAKKRVAYVQMGFQISVHLICG